MGTQGYYYSIEISRKKARKHIPGQAVHISLDSKQALSRSQDCAWTIKCQKPKHQLSVDMHIIDIICKGLVI